MKKTERKVERKQTVSTASRSESTKKSVGAKAAEAAQRRREQAKEKPKKA